MNKTSIWSVIALSIIDYSKKTNAEQLEAKKLLDGFIRNAVIDIAQDDRLIVDTTGGAVIICSGPLEDALEDALFISITIRDEILNNNIHAVTPLYVQFGIHLGAARMVNNSMVGEGVDEVQRIMSFAKPNQILVSNVYYGMASKLTQEIAQMFEKYEMHALDHDVYSVRLLKETAAEEPLISADNLASTKRQSVATKANWTYFALSLLVLAAFFALAKTVVTPVEPIITVEEPVVAEPTTETELNVEPNQANTKQKDVNTAKAAQKKSSGDNPAKTDSVTSQPEKTVENIHAKPAESKAESNSKTESAWGSFKDSVKKGTKHECTQAEIALNQCAQ